MMGKENKKEVLFSLIGVFILIFAVVGISYAVWSKTLLGEKENSLTTGSISFQYHESDTNVISITNALPTEDSQGKKQSGSNRMFDFSVSGGGMISYDVYATQVGNNTLPGEYVKIYLTDQNDHPVSGYQDKIPLYSELSDYSYGNQSGKLLYSSKLTSKSTHHNLRLRIWVDSDYRQADRSSTFAFKVNVAGSM